MLQHFLIFDIDRSKRSNLLDQRFISIQKQHLILLDIFKVSLILLLQILKCLEFGLVKGLIFHKSSNI